MADNQQITPYQGGLDLVTPPLRRPPGTVIACKNHEVTAEGYRRCDGEERFDGQPKPSLAWPLRQVNFDAGTTEPSINDKITDETSGAVGYLHEAAVVTSGAWGTNDAAGWLILRNVTGTFGDNNNLQESASTFAVANGAMAFPVYESEETKEAYRQAAITQARNLISAVTGSGDILGGASYGGDQYVWRNNAGGTAAAMFKATEAGWVEQTFGHTLDFTAGTAEIAEEASIVGSISSAEAEVERVVVTSGTWGGGDAAGYLVLSGISGTFQAETITVDGGSGSATASGAQAAITLPAGGEYRAKVHNFYGTSNLRRLYFVNGQGKAHEWDGTVLAPISTGLSAALDKPTHIGVHASHLLLGFRGGSVMTSGVGLPLSFLALDGAAEVGLGEDITGIISAARTSTIIAGRNKVSYLTGSDSDTFNLEEISDDSGAIANTMQQIGQPYLVDDNGLRSLSATASFGDWTMNTASRMVEPLFKQKREAGLTIVGSIRVRRKDQYRLYYSDGSGISFYFGASEPPQPLTFQLGFTPTCFWSGEDGAGNEILMAGSDTGMVYEMDAGQGQDGSAMEYFLRLSFRHQGSPNHIKRYRWLIPEIIGGGQSNTLNYAADFSYGDGENPSRPEEEFTVYGDGGFWDEMTWDEFTWDSPAANREMLRLNGRGTNISVVWFGSAAWEDPYILSGDTIIYALRKLVR